MYSQVNSIILIMYYYCFGKMIIYLLSIKFINIISNIYIWINKNKYKLKKNHYYSIWLLVKLTLLHLYNVLKKTRQEASFTCCHVRKKWLWKIMINSNVVLRTKISPFLLSFFRSNIFHQGRTITRTTDQRTRTRHTFAVSTAPLEWKSVCNGRERERKEREKEEGKTKKKKEVGTYI